MIALNVLHNSDNDSDGDGEASIVLMGARETDEDLLVFSCSKAQFMKKVLRISDLSKNVANQSF